MVSKEWNNILRVRLFVWIIAALLMLTSLVPSTASAYSYGDPNEEAVAESYKRVAGLLNQSTPDFTAAMNELKTIQEELDMHMGEKPAQAIEQALAEKNKEQALDAFQKTLVLNIARRMKSAEDSFEDYTQGKLLLAKAKSTYEALAPIVKANDASVDESIRKGFEETLQALGNPGLFGVGVREPDRNQFVSNKDEILGQLQTQFQLESLEVSHFKVGDGPGSTEESSGTSQSSEQIKNWLPLGGLLFILVAVFLFARRRRRK